MPSCTLLLAGGARVRLAGVSEEAGSGAVAADRAETLGQGDEGWARLEPLKYPGRKTDRASPEGGAESPEVAALLEELRLEATRILGLIHGGEEAARGRVGRMLQAIPECG